MRKLGSEEARVSGLATAVLVLTGWAQLIGANDTRRRPARAAEAVYEFGNMSGIAPWNDETSIFQRNGQSETQNVIAKSIGVPADRFKGEQNSGRMRCSIIRPRRVTARTRETETRDAIVVNRAL